MNSANLPQGGGPGTAQRQAYTYPLPLIYNGLLFIFAIYDLSENGPRYLAKAFGLESNWGIWICLLLGLVFAMFPVSVASVLYTKYTGRVYTEDRLGFARSGGQDIGTWSGLLTYTAVLWIFARDVSPDWLGWFRPVAVLLITLVVGLILAAVIGNMVFARRFSR